jgi:CMP-N-acetylneuraminic acid synthetase
MKLLIFIPARKGSKEIKNKNMILIKKKPLIYYTIKTAKNIAGNKSIFVSTDSSKIKKYIKKFNINYEYLRPKYLSEDNSNITDAVIHTLNWLKKRQEVYDAVIILQPTSPLRNIKNINNALKIFKKNKIKSMISVTASNEHPYECIVIKKKKWNFLVKNQKENRQRQKYVHQYYFIDGSFYILDYNYLIKFKKIISKKFTIPFIQKNVPSLDINNYNDLKIFKAFL